MPPRRRNKASNARSAAIQAVERRRRQQQSSQPDDEDDDHPHHNVASSLSPFLGGGPGDSSSGSGRRSSIHSDTAVANRNSATLLDTTNKDGCLHCLQTASESNIQVRCDECQSYICQTCHWCHEFQANHEIRVCDRCDAFYCRNCDEMDQCDDCGEVVCASCSTLLSCKFCGGGLCEECATACGRCGIVLCSRDAKFAVDCDTCRLSYCLVCLASGSKDPCVRCGHRPSKRMEQLVHLRLKSIYKAFKQSSRKANGMTIEELEETKHISDHGNNNGDDEDDDDEEDEETLLSTAAGISGHALPGGGGSLNHAMPSSITSSNTATNLILETEKYMALKQKADAAAEALLAELEEEEEAMKSKKSKKKRKKEKKQQQQAKHHEQEQEQEQQKEKGQRQKGQTKKTPETPSKQQKKSQQSSSPSNPMSPMSPMATPDKEADTKNTPTSGGMDPMEKRFLELVQEEDENGLEDLLFELKGIPGRASLRKNAKKALKRLRTVAVEEAAAAAAAASAAAPAPSGPIASPPVSGNSELLRLVSDNHVTKSNRVECVMQISPTVVGWVIGKGGQRIRDLMEESGAKVWIDQEKIAKPNDPRNVYISGERQCVDQAVKMMKDIVSNSPANHTGGDVAAAWDEPRHVHATVVGTAPVHETVPPVQAQTNPSLISQQIDRAIQDAQNQAASKKAAAAVKAKAKATPAPAPPQPVQQPLAKVPAPVQVPKVTPPLPAEQPHPPAAENVVPDDFAQHILTCEARFVPLLIGKRGWTIKNIQDESGARVDIDQTVVPRQIRLSGSKANVDVAIGMVRDVLSYPHAQLMQSDDKQTIDVNQQPVGVLPNSAPPPNASPERDDHFSPPASLIMTGDSKSLISASSSLSSTPEPSMASNPKVYQVPASGPLIPPEYPGGGNNTSSSNNLMRPAASSNVFSGQQEMGFDNPMPGAPPRGFGGPPYGNPPGLMGMQHHIPGMAMPNHHPHPPPHHQMYAPAPKPPMPPMGSNMPEGFDTGNSMLHNLGNNMHPRHGLNFGMMGNNANNSPALPPVHPQQLVNPHYNNGNRQENPLRNVIPRGGRGLGGPPPFHAESKLPVASGGNLWDGSPASYGSAGGLQKPNHDGYFGDGLRNQVGQAPQQQPPLPQQQRPQDGMPLGFNIGQTAAPGATTHNSFVPSLDPTPTTEPVRDDSKMVDSLFAPAGNSNQPETLLSGFNGLSIDGDGGLGGATSGLWGNSGLSSTWESGKAGSVPKEDLSSSLLAGLPPLHLPDDHHQHPPQSRFNWSSTNA